MSSRTPASYGVLSGPFRSKFWISSSIVCDRSLTVCQAFGATSEFTFNRNYPPTINHKRETEFVRSVLQSVAGSQRVSEFEPTMGAEDFSFYLNEIPGCYFMIGNGAGDHRANGHGVGPCTLHNPCYDFNDALVPLGGKAWARLAEAWLV
jgi:metal-dependent amidase/aminoacylase/carboxypeptidase family protein